MKKISLKSILEGEEQQSNKFSNDAKRNFLEIVSTYNKYQEMMDRKSDITKIAETLGAITDAAQQLAINEEDDWFDKHTVKRNMSDLKKLGEQFDKVARESAVLDQRMTGLYEDMGHILSRYYKIGEITEDEMKSRLGMTNEGRVNEGRKRFYQQDSIGNSKYTISFHDGKQTHKDGSDFYGIRIFKSKPELEKFRKELLSKGYKEDSGFRKESVNEEIYWVNSNNKYELGRFYDEVKNFMPDHSIQKLSPLSIQFDISKNDLKDVEKMAKTYKGLKVVKESVNEADDSGLKYSKNGFVHTALGADGKRAKEVTVDGMVYRYNPVYKTYNSVKGNELLTKYTVSSAKKITRS